MINAIWDQNTFEILIQEIKSINVNRSDAEIVVEQVNCFVNDSWQKSLPEFLNNAVEAAKRKACDEKCIKVYYANRKK